ncbi:hypothetical protein AB0M54_36695 [Actinoplanes sp. NPDC051470]|uniref:hypothetical protein n=1 Tax=unclassified Actinoplanes TaxID=2626549 RepID=UPI003414B987
MKRALVALALVALAGGCGTATPGGAPAGPPPSAAAPSSAPPKSAAPASSKAAPAFADLTQGSAKTVVKMYSFDADNSAAVVEPIDFKTAVCAADAPDCNREWDTEDSRSKVTVPLAEKPKYFTWQDDNGDVCLKKPEDGGTCPMKEKAFADWIKENPGEMVAITTDNGEIVRAALVYVP